MKKISFIAAGLVILGVGNSTLLNSRHETTSINNNARYLSVGNESSVLESNFIPADLGLDLDKLFESNSSIMNEVTPQVASYQFMAEGQVESVPSDEIMTLSVQEENTNEVLGISIADTYVNVRENADTESAIVGRLYNGAFATVQSVEGDWAHITSGQVSGYVSLEFLATGEEAEALRGQYTKTTATIQTATLNVRSEMSTEAQVIDQVAEGTQHTVLGESDEWVTIQVSGTNSTGYVSKEYVTVTTSNSIAMTMEEVNAMIAAEEAAKKAKEEAIAKAAEAAKQAKQAAAAKANAAKTSTATVSKDSSDVKLIASLIFCEAGGEPYEGKLAVANVVLNRVKSSKYPSSVSSVIYQGGQFGPASSGSLAKQLNRYSSYSSKSELECIQAAKAALSGQNNIGSRTNFNTSTSNGSAIRIGHHLFW